MWKEQNSPPEEKKKAKVSTKISYMHVLIITLEKMSCTLLSYNQNWTSKTEELILKCTKLWYWFQTWRTFKATIVLGDDKSRINLKVHLTFLLKSAADLIVASLIILYRRKENRKPMKHRLWLFRDLGSSCISKASTDYGSC